MSYHSYRNIGFLFTETEANCRKWRDRFAGFDPARALAVLDTSLEEDCVKLTYFGQPFRLHLGSGVLEKQTEDGWSEALFMNEALVVYHILGDVVAEPRTVGEWVPEPELDPVRIRSGNRTDPMLQEFARGFSGKVTELVAACEAAGGRRIDQADAAYEFRPFPQTPIRLVYWDADEEFPAQVQALVDRGITDYMHFEAVGCMIADLFGHLTGGEHRRI